MDCLEIMMAALLRYELWDGGSCVNATGGGKKEVPDVVHIDAPCCRTGDHDDIPSATVVAPVAYTPHRASRDHRQQVRRVHKAICLPPAAGVHMQGVYPLEPQRRQLLSTPRGCHMAPHMAPLQGKQLEWGAERGCRTARSNLRPSDFCYYNHAPPPPSVAACRCSVGDCAAAFFCSSSTRVDQKQNPKPNSSQTQEKNSRAQLQQNRTKSLRARPSFCSR